jgi:hexosaminidase
MDHLDLHSPELVAFMKGLWGEYLSGSDPVFAGPNVHVGTDEYSKAETEAFRLFTDTMFKMVKGMGKNVRAWGALTHAQGKTPVDSSGVVLDIWYNPYHQPLQAIEEGYKIVSIPDGTLYIVPAAGYYYDYLNIQGLYNNWTPANISNVTLPPAHPSLLGGRFAIWNDHIGNGISQQDAHDRLFPAVLTLGQKMWSGKVEGQTFERFKELIKQRTVDAPGVNLTGRVRTDTEGLALSLFTDSERSFKLGEYAKTGVKEIGWSQDGGYTVSFSIKLTAAPKTNTTLFCTPETQFKLMQEGTGKLGFSRDGYHYSFDYVLPAGEWVGMTITGDNKGTDLYVNGVLKDSLRNRKFTFPKTGKEIRSIQTLMFPLEQVGGFDGLIRDVSVKTGVHATSAK